MENQKILLNKKAKVVTMGCQLNESDSEKLMGMLTAMGASLTDETELADIIIFNTCAVRENAEKKVLGLLGSLKKKAEEKPDMLIGICGCTATQPHIAELIKKKYRHVRLVFGTCSLARFPELIQEAMQSGKTVIDIEQRKEVPEGLPVCRSEGPKAWLPVMFGCDNFCSYCVVPHVRGRERSRAPQAILAEAKAIALQGKKEIMLLGQNVNSYGKGLAESVDFASLLYLLNDVEGIERIRFMTSHPKDIHPRLIEAMAFCDRVCKQLHLPVQSGSDSVLSAMNRHYTRAQYLEKIAYARQMMPDVVLSTDIMVGFPGETEEDFEDTLSLMKEVRYDSAFTFIYSRREGTPAATWENQIPEDIVHERFERLVQLQNQISLEKNQALSGKTLTVLCEGASKNDPGTLTGRTEGNRLVHFKGDPSWIGKMISVRITQAESFCLYGEVL